MSKHTIECPDCSTPLFHVAQVAPGMNGKHVDDPESDSDASGQFVTCPACSRRVDLDVYSTTDSGARVRVRRT